MAKVDVSLVLACFNEGPTCLNSLKKIKKTLETTPYRWEMICIDDKSNDDTPKVIEQFAKKYQNIFSFFHKKNIGRGGTVSEGIKRARGKVVGFIDVDLEVSPVYIPEFIQAIRDGADVAIATRVYKEGFSSLNRWLASRGYSMLVQKLLGLNFKDTEAGYKFFKLKKILPVLKKAKDKKWFFDTEIIARSKQADLNIVEIPVLFLRRTDKKSTVKILKDSITYLKAVYKFKKGT